MHRLPPSVRRFLDLEAGVDDDDDDDDEEEEEEEEEEEALRSAPIFSLHVSKTH
jgi:hypothetical protein